MICLSKRKDGPEFLVEYLSRTLDAARTAEFAQHITACEECRGLVRAWDALDEWKAPEVSPDFDARLYARIAEESRTPRWRRSVRRLFSFEGGWRPAIPVAAGCAVLALALLIRSPEPVEIAPQTKAETINMDQVERDLEVLDLLAPMGPAEEL